MIVITILIIGGWYFLFFDRDSSQIIEENKVIEELKIIESTSDLALQISDFPEGWEIKSRGERSISDVSIESINLGWKEGYSVEFRDKENPDKQVLQLISSYPIENMGKVLDQYKNEVKLFSEGLNGVKKEFAIESYGIRYRVEKISCENYGDESICLKKSYIDGNLPDIYYIEFIDEKYFILLGGYDNELLKELAQKVDSMIK